VKPEKFLLELEQILEQAGYTLRKERGSFRGNECIIEGQKLVMVNKNKPVESQLGTMGRVLGQIDLTGVYIKPAVRKKLDDLWDQLAVTPEETSEDFELE
jgi:Na+-transporting NADH:ubiquinone oxidoreductase subunit NqrD|tara:strand:+ start:473 stop:772 length:300 start_codon:yes stop_codon:yes gene_type:complete